MMPHLSTRDEQLLSDYLDGQLSARDVAAFEKRLRVDKALQTAVSDLRRLKVMLQRVPRYRVPRNFMLTPAMVNAKARRSKGFWLPLMRLSTAAAVFLLAAVFVLEGLPGGIPALRANPIPAAAPAMHNLAAENVDQANPPPIIPRNDPAQGHGGGGEVPAVIEVQPNEKQMETQVEPQAEPQALMAPAAPLATPAPALDIFASTPAAGLAVPPALSATESAAPAILPFTVESLVEDAVPAAGQEEDSNAAILGIRPTDERHMLATPDEMAKAVPPVPPVPSEVVQQNAPEEGKIWLWIKAALVLAALFTGTAAVLLQRKAKM
ncbi:MAG: anti-sigma factor [Anaerolineaceae bacterium]